MDLLTLYTTWLGLFSISFTFLPIAVKYKSRYKLREGVMFSGLLLDWKKRGTSEGFSSINFICAMTVQACWFKFGLLTNDNTQIYLNLVNLFMFVIYMAVFIYYQRIRKYAYLQICVSLSTIFLIYSYVALQDPSEQPDLMGSIASTAQMLSLAGGIYEIKRVISMGTTEYLPASFQYALFLLIGQWTIFGVWSGNIHILKANIAGLAVNLITIGLYFIYPPLTWRVPIIGTGPAEKKKE